MVTKDVSVDIDVYIKSFIFIRKLKKVLPKYFYNLDEVISG